ECAGKARKDKDPQPENEDRPPSETIGEGAVNELAGANPEGENTESELHIRGACAEMFRKIGEGRQVHVGRERPERDGGGKVYREQRRGGIEGFHCTYSKGNRPLITCPQVPRHIYVSPRHLFSATCAPPGRRGASRQPAPRKRPNGPYGEDAQPHARRYNPSPLRA